MRKTPDVIDAQVHTPSIGSVLYQCRTLRAHLGTITSPRYPNEAMRIAAVFDLLAERAERRLEALLGRAPQLRKADEHRTRQLARLVHQLYSYVRYLQAADPISSPPGVQTAFSALVDAHVPLALGCPKEEIVALVRPQWEYNHKFVDLTNLLQRIDVADLDENFEFYGDDDSNDMRSFIDELWEARVRNGENAPKPPKHMAILSFAGLDRDDVLLYPLLAHEVGHFIDFAYEGTIHDNPKLESRTWLPTNDDVSRVLNSLGALEELPLFRLRELTRAREHVADLIQTCLRELTADLLAIRMVGLSFFIALAEFLKTIAPLDAAMVVPATGYPGSRFRLKIAFDELCDTEAGIDIEAKLRRIFGQEAPTKVLAYLARWRNVLTEETGHDSKPTDLKTALASLAAERVAQALPKLRALVRTVIPSEKSASVSEQLSFMLELLKERMPPFPHVYRLTKPSGDTQPVPFADVLTAGWIYELEVGEDREDAHESSATKHLEYQNTCTLLFKALELESARSALGKEHATPDLRPSSKGTNSIGAATGPYILDALGREALGNRLMIIPYYGNGALQSASLDVHLGSWFKVAKRTDHASFDLANAAAREAALREAQEEVHVRWGGKFVLHPGSFALGVTVEYVALPGDLMAFVEGKSSLGRAGLIIATAAQVAPGFKGCVVLELFNAGTVPLVLRPGMRVAQLVFHTLDQPLPREWLYAGGFRCQVKP